MKGLHFLRCAKKVGNLRYNIVLAVKPIPPKIPKLTDCCGNGCPNCVLDTYYIQQREYEKNYTKYKKYIKTINKLEKEDKNV